MNIRKFALACAAALVVATAPAKSDAAVIQLGFILDSSGSIGAGGWTTIVNGLSTAITNNIPVGGTNTYEISVVSFSSTASVIVNHMLIDSIAARTAAAAAVAAAPFLNANTNFALAFSTMQTVLTGSTNCSPTGAAGICATAYVNFATDGVPNEGGGDAGGIAARNNLITAGVDNISIEGIGGGVDAANLQANYCYPQPCDTTSPYNFPAQGFYIGVVDAAGYAAAIGNKIIVVTQTPEPGTLALVGLAIGFLGLASRRRKA